MTRFALHLPYGYNLLQFLTVNAVRVEFTIQKEDGNLIVRYLVLKDKKTGIMPNPAYSYYNRTYKSDAPTWSEKMAVASHEAFYSYNALVHVPLIAPAPFQIIHGTKDVFLLPKYARQAYDAALGPKGARLDRDAQPY